MPKLAQAHGCRLLNAFMNPPQLKADNGEKLLDIIKTTC
jgi:hypothetical protein